MNQYAINQDAIDQGVINQEAIDQYAINQGVINQEAIDQYAINQDAINCVSTLTLAKITMDARILP